MGQQLGAGLGVPGVVAAVLAMEDAENQPHRVEAGQQGAQQARQKKARVAGRHGLPENFILAVKAGRHQRQGHQGRPPNQETGIGHRQALSQPAQPGHILLMVATGDHRTGRQEQQRLEEGVGDQVENGGIERPDAERQEHITNLAHGGIGQHPLDIGLGQGSEGRQQQRDRANDADQPEDIRGQQEQPVEAGNQVDPGGDHGRRVNQGRDRGRARHGIRQPGMQRYLGGFAQGTAQQQQCDKTGRGIPRRPDLGGARHHLLDIQGAQLPENQEQTQGQKHIANPGHHEGLERGHAVGAVLIVVADQQVTAQANPFPAQEQQEQIVPEHQHEHAEDKQVHPGIEPGNACLAGHIPGGKQVDEEAHTGNNCHHHQGEAIHRQTDGRFEGAHLHPGPEREANRATSMRVDRYRPGRRQGRQPHTGNANAGADPWPQTASGKRQHQGAHQGQDKGQGDQQLHHPRILLTRSRLRDRTR